MSLVAYNSSDESDQSDAEDESAVNHVNDKTTSDPAGGHISDEDEYVPTGSANTSVTETAVVDRGPKTVGVDSSVTNSLKGLPAPKSSEDDKLGEDELEEEVKPKLAQVSDAPKPPPKRAKQPVKISIPKLQTATESDEEEEPVAKKARNVDSNKGKSGLFALLPAPVHVARKETNRILIPHTLTKRPQAKKPIQKPAKPKPESDAGSTDTGFTKRFTAFGGLTGYDSDSDEETTTSNFFLLESGQEQSKSNKVKSNPDVKEQVSQSGKHLSDDASNVSQAVKTSSRTVTVQSADESVLPAVVSHIPSTESESVSPSVMDQDAPLSFKPTIIQPNPLSAASVGAHYRYYQPGSSSMEEPQDAYPQYEEFGAQPEEDIHQYMQDEQFLRLQGKNKRGKEEINIIDANMDDFVNTVDVAKNLTEESSYQSHRKKDNNPTTQQRRKKQITYLAFQAKERELELKNSWAQSRMTKRQTQAKYGF